MEIKCRVCGGETNQQDGICRACALFRKDEVEALKNNSRFKIQDSKFKNNGGAEMKEKDYSGHRKCSTEGCFKYAVKDGKCTRHFNEAHGIKTRIGRKPKAVSVNSVSDSKKKRGRPSKAVIPASLSVIPACPESFRKEGLPTSGNDRKNKSRGNGDYDGIMLKLITAKSDYQQKVAEIESAIGVLKKYA